MTRRAPQLHEFLSAETDAVLTLWLEMRLLDREYGVALRKWIKHPTESNRLAAGEIKDEYHAAKAKWEIERKKQ